MGKGRNPLKKDEELTMTTPLKPLKKLVSQDDTAAGQVVWMPKRIYHWLRRLAEAESRPVSRQLEVIITEWLESSLKQTEMISEYGKMADLPMYGLRE